MGTICHSCGRRNQESRKICQFCGSELFPSRVESNVISSGNIAYGYDELIPIEVNHTHRDALDKYDYLTAAGTGVVAGLIDVFLVRSPKNSKLVDWTDGQVVDNYVKSFAKLTGWESDNNVKSAISHLERKFSVNYDQRHTGDIGGIFKMSAKNHHMKSVAHSPDIIGLFFSILNQITGTSSFFANGKLITVSSSTQELIGGNFISKIFCGFVNWFGHLMSDIAGSSDAKGRGTGIVAPFYELLELCKFNNSDYGDLATIATKAFEQGYDARFALTTSIPVLISDLLTRFIWGLRNYFQYKRPIKECIPTEEHSDLRIMLLISNACLCSIDVADEAIRSKFIDPVTFVVHLNLAAWIKIAVRGVKEIANRCRHKEEYKYSDNTSNDFNIDDEDREIFLNSSWRQFIGASSVESLISSFRFYHNAKWERKANRCLAYAIVLATSEEIDTKKMINTYFSNNGSAEFLSNAFKVGWYCSPNYYMAKKYRTGNYTYEFVEIV